MRDKNSTEPIIFLFWSDQITERIDPLFYASDVYKFIRKSKFDVVELGSVTSLIKAGFAAGKHDQDNSDGGVPQIRPTNIDNFGGLKFDKTISLPLKLQNERSQDIVQKGEILFNNTNSQELVGKTAYFDLHSSYFCSNHITRIKTNESRLIPQFLWILLNTYQAQNVFFKICVNWNNQSGVNVELLRTLKIPLPSLKIQEQVVQFAQKAYKEKKKKEAEIKTILASIDKFVLGELGIERERDRESENLQIWEIWSDTIEKRIDPMYFHPLRTKAIEAIKKSSAQVSPLNEIVKFRRELVSDIPENATYIGLENIVSNSGEYIETNVKESISSAFIFKKGDVLFPKLRPYLNKVFYADFDGICSTEFHVIEAEKCDPYFLFSFLTRSVVVEQTSRLMTGNTLPRLQTEDIDNLLIPIPNDITQSKITAGVRITYEQTRQLRKEAKSIIVEGQKQMEQMIFE